MARGSQQAQQGSTEALANASTYGGNANAIFGNLEPMLMTQAANPQGMSPLDLSRMQTSNQQSAGGTQAAAVGQGALRAARTRNAGGADAAVAASARSAGRNLAEANLKGSLANAQLKEKQQLAAEGELGNLYGTSVGGSNAALSANAANVNANTNAENASWDWATDLFDPIMKNLSVGVKV